MSDLARKLRTFVDDAMHNGRGNLHDALRDLADLITDAFDSELRDVVLDRRRANEIFDHARSAAWLVDACHIVKSRLLAGRASGCFLEFALPRSRTYDSLDAFLDSDVRHEIDEHPFVYCVWKRSPQRFLYVGKSQNRDGRAQRLKLDGRGKLLGAMQEGSLFTLMFPSPANATIALDVEAAILTVLENCNAPSEFNDKREKVPGAVGSAYLADIGQLLIDLGDRLRPTSERLTEIVS